MLLKVTFSPFNQQKFSINLIIKGQRYDDVFTIPLVANTLEEKPELPQVPTKKGVIVEFNPKPKIISIDKILPPTKSILPEEPVKIPGLTTSPITATPVKIPGLTTSPITATPVKVEPNFIVPSINTAPQINFYDKTTKIDTSTVPKNVIVPNAITIPATSVVPTQQPLAKTTTSVIPATSVVPTQQPLAKTTTPTQFTHDSRKSVGAGNGKRTGR